MNTGPHASPRRFPPAISTYVLKTLAYAYPLEMRNFVVFHRTRTASSADWRTTHEYCAIRISSSIPPGYFHILVEIFYTRFRIAAAELHPLRLE